MKTRSFRTMFAAFAVVAIALVSVADAQPGRGGMRGGGIASLLQIEGVADELDLSDDQVKDAKEVAEELQGKLREEMSKEVDFRGMRDASEEERAEMMKKVQEFMVKAAKKEKEALGDVLLEHQVERLEELRVQQLGSRALSDAAVTDKLKITDEQKEKITEVGESIRDEMREMFQGGGGFDQEKMTELREKAEKDVMAVLTKKQKSTLEQMKGEKFEFPERQFGGRGGRGGDGGGRGGRGGDGGRRGDRPAADDTD